MDVMKPPEKATSADATVDRATEVAQSVCSCTCEPYWADYGRRDPQCAWHSGGGEEIVDALVAAGLIALRQVVDEADLRAVLDELPDDPRLGSGAGDRLRALGRPHRHRGAAVGDAPSDDVKFERQHLRALTDWIDQQTVAHGLPADVAAALQAGCDTVDGVR